MSGIDKRREARARMEHDEIARQDIDLKHIGLLAKAMAEQKARGGGGTIQVEYEAYCKAERDRSRARQKVILSFIQKTSTRWPIYFGPEAIDKHRCQVATIDAIGNWQDCWHRYMQCLGKAQISKGKYLYCGTHDPDRPWPVGNAAKKKLDAMGVRVPKYNPAKASTIERRTLWKSLWKKWLGRIMW